jgi:predicted nucleic acid-binding protein
LILLDTNILLRYALATDPLFATVDTAITSLHAGGEVLCVVPQNVYEFWATATRPTASNGLGLSIPEGQVQVARTKRLFRLLSDLPTLFAEWEVLVGAQSCHGRVSYDAQLVAAMRTHGITRLLTFNGSDFARFPGITILDPAILPGPAPPPIATAGPPLPISAP